MPGEEARLRSEVARLYWETDDSVAEIADRLGISRRALYDALEPAPAGVSCPACGDELVYANRTARSAGRGSCPSCGWEGVVGALTPSSSAEAERLAGVSRASESVLPEHEPGVEQEWDAARLAPLDEEAALRSRAVLLGSAALAGVAVGALAAFLVSRRS